VAHPPALMLDGLMSEAEAKIVRCHSRMRAVIYPHDGDPIFSERSTTAKKIEFDDPHQAGDFSLRMFQWSKVLGQAAGKWTATIKVDPRFSFLQPERGDLLPGDWIEFEFLRNGVTFPLCIGIIDTIEEDKTSIGGATRTVWNLTGRDFAKVLEHPITYSNIFARQLGEIVAGLMTKRVKGKIGGSPAELFRLILEAAFTEGRTSTIWQVPKSFGDSKGMGPVRMIDVVDIQDGWETAGAYYNEVQLWNKSGQTLAQALDFWCFPLLHQLTYDVADPDRDQYGSTSLPVRAVIRQRPYINTADGIDSPWFDLPTWTIPSWLIKRRSLARSDLERFNIIQLLTDVGWEGSSAEQTITAAPQYAPESIKRYGIRAYTPNTHFIAGGLDKWATLRGEQQDLLVDWHSPNPYFLSGNVALPIPLVEARIGHRLKIDSGTPGEMLTLFIEGHQLTYQASTSPEEPPRGTSTLMVTRGYKGTDQEGLALVQKCVDMYEDLV
jgi:hypothetical protein